MTDDEMRTLLAERVMGWHLRGHGGDRWWFDKDVLRAMRSDEWHPEEILEQAMMVAEAINNHLFSVRLRFINALLNQAREAGNIEALWWFMFMADKPRAIFMAAAQVAGEDLETDE